MSIKHRFMPLVSMTLREDGRYDLEIDWAGAQVESWDDEDEEVVCDEPGQPGHDACVALDAWVRKTGAEDGKHRFIVSPTTNA